MLGSLQSRRTETLEGLAASNKILRHLDKVKNTGKIIQMELKWNSKRFAS